MTTFVLMFVSFMIAAMRITGSTHRLYVDAAHMWVAGLAGATIIAYAAVHKVEDIMLPARTYRVLEYRVITHHLFWILCVVEIVCFAFNRHR